MQAGQLRHYFTIKQPQRAPDGSGGYVVTWATVGNVWGGIATRNAAEQNRGGQQVQVDTDEITLRAPVTLDNSMILVLGSDTWTVQSVTDVDERGRTVRVNAKRGMPA